MTMQVILRNGGEHESINVALVTVYTGPKTASKQIMPSDPACVLSIDNVHTTPDGKTCIYSVRRVLSDLTECTVSE